MAHLTLLGLGPGAAHHLTEEARHHLAAAPTIWLRTRIHPTVDALPGLRTARSFDDYYDLAEDWDSVYGKIAEEVVAFARFAPLTYAVPGHPLVAESTTRRIVARAREEGVPCTVVAGLSFVDVVCSTLSIDPYAAGLQLLDALDLLPPPVAAPVDEGGRAWSEMQGIGTYQSQVVPFPLVATRPALLSQLYNRRIASEVKLTLGEIYPESHPVTVVHHAGLASEIVRTVPLHELDHQPELDHLTALFVPPLAAERSVREPEGLRWVIARLLGPNGCPWDRKQTHASLRPFLLEETYEVLEALDTGDFDALAEELGDVLLQILLHSEMARQAGHFDWPDVVAHLTEKLIRRHPHVFGDVAVDGSDEVLRNWDTIKQQERAERGKVAASILDGVPPGLPALVQAQQLTAKAAKVHFDWTAVEDVWDKVAEEIGEIREIAADDPQRHERLQEELGDLLFAVGNVARWLHIDGETALREANAKFRRRFLRMEALADARGTHMAELDPAAQDRLWTLAKQEEQDP
ncbi:MAG: nucleoside triphosphate pyrophosphohydrolase [Herpetosiphon sp.]